MGLLRRARFACALLALIGFVLAVAPAAAVAQTNVVPTVANEIPDQVAGPGVAFSYTFPATTFDDADGDTLTYTAVEDGETGLPSWLRFTGRTFSGTPAVADAGTLTVKVTASDGNGGSVSDSFDIGVGGVCLRTPAVRDGLIWRARVDACADVTAAHLAAMTELNLENAGIDSLKADDFAGLTNLKELRLRSNRLTSLPSGTFDGLTGLNELWLDGNDLTTLPSGIFDDLSGLTRLELGFIGGRSASISSLPDGIFDKLGALTHLDVDGIPRSSWPAGVFDSLTSLRALNLSETGLGDLPADFFDNNVQLGALYMDGAGVRTLAPGIFEPLTNLNVLCLKPNPGHRTFVPTAKVRDAAVHTGGAVTLDAGASGGPWGSNVSFSWRQTGGTTVALTGADTATPSFTAPAAPGALTFEVTVSDKATESKDECAETLRTDTATATVRVSGGCGDAHDGALRLAGGGPANEGRLEICHDDGDGDTADGDGWGLVCARDWSFNDAQVACRALGYDSAESGADSTYLPFWNETVLYTPALSVRRAHEDLGIALTAQDPSEFWLTRLKCTGQESGLLACPRSGGLGGHSCRAREAVGVRCVNDGVQPEMVRVHPARPVNANPFDDGAFDEVEVVFEFDREVFVDTSEGEPKVWAQVASERSEGGRGLAYAGGSGGRLLAFRGPLGASDLPLRALSVVDDSFRLMGATVRGRDGFEAFINQRGAGAVPFILGAPALKLIDADDDNAFGAGDKVEVTLTFTEPVVAAATSVGVPYIALVAYDTDGEEIGGSVSLALYTRGNGTRELVFSYTVAGVFAGAAFVAARYNRLSTATTSEGVITSQATGEVAAGDHVGSGLQAASFSSSAHAAPAVEGVPGLSAAGADGTWTPGETVEVTLGFSEAVTVDAAGGAPSVGLLLGGGARREAAYARGSGTASLVFAYTLAGGDGSHAGMLVPPDSLALNGGTIRSTATGADAALSHLGAGSVAVVRTLPEPGPTARFEGVPASHDGTSAFEVELTFSGDPGGLGYRTVRDSLIEVTGGAIGNARRKTKGSDAAWVLTVRPSGRGSVTLTLPSRACGSPKAANAICIGGAPLASAATATVPGPDTPAVSIAGPADTPVDEGAALSFTLTRTGTADGALTVAVSVAETGDVLDGTPPASVRFAPGSATAALSVPTLDDEAFEEASTVTVTVADGTGYTVDGDAASASGVVESEDRAPITAQFTQAQDEHDGGAFLLQFTFSHAPLLSYVTVRDALFDVTGGRIERARRLTQDSNAGWELRVVPDGFGDVALTARATADCAAAHAVCDAAGRKFDGALERTIQGPPTLSIADAAVDEARGATLDFAVTLSRALGTAVTVAWKTADVTAEAGFDYTAANDTLTFAAGETAKTISVAVLTDAHDEGSETLTVTLSDLAPSRVKLADGAATGTIRNTDAMPQAWIARFGRTVAEQVLDAVEGRLRAARTPGVEVSLAGERIGWRPEAVDGRASAEDRTARAAAAKDAAAEEEAGREAARLADWLKGETDPEEERRRQGRTVGNRGLLLGSSFNVTAEAEGPGSGGGTVSVWGRGAVTNFDGRDGELTVDGEVASAMLGADWSPGSGSGAGRALAGLIVGHSTGEGGYRSPSGNGTVTSTLTGLYPWGRHALTDRVEVWGAAGYGEGALTLTPEGGDAIRTDMDLWMAAAGLQGTVIDGGADGFTLTAKTDAMAVETSTAAVAGDLAASEAGVTRLRLGLEGSLPVRLGGGAVLTPSMEIGARHDGGDAETGFGADIGGGIAWKDPKRGIAAEIRGRGLLTHEADGFRQRGLSGTLGWNPVEGDRGPSLSLTQTFGGAASGGADALLRRGTLEGLAANDNGAGDGGDLKARRLEARFGYGFAAFGDGFTFTPEAGFGLSDTGRDYSLGWRLVRVERGSGLPGASLELSFEATRRESAAGANAPPDHGVGLRLRARF